MKINKPLALHRFRVASSTKGNPTTDDIEEEFTSVMSWIRSEQEEFFNSPSFDALVNKLITSKTPITGSLNSFGRRMGIGPSHQFAHHSYNTAEMFRASVMQKVAGYFADEMLSNIIAETPELKPSAVSVVAEFKKKFPHLKAPTHGHVQQVVDRLIKDGTLNPAPSADSTLPLWACDTHYCKVAYNNGCAFLSLATERFGKVVLAFAIPNKNYYRKNLSKLTRPTVAVDKNGRLSFIFTVEERVALPVKTSTMLGVDIGKVKNYTATAMDENYFSAPYVDAKNVNGITQDINQLYVHKSSLYAKEQLCLDHGRNAKASALKTERQRITSKISRLKSERAQKVATELVSLAQKHNATIVLENLSWAKSGKWERKIVQDKIERTATLQSIQVKKVSPANTSRMCVKCKKHVTYSKRVAVCKDCSVRVDRDVLASRNIAMRGNAKIDYNCLTQKSSAPRARRSRPVTPGSHTIDIHDSLDTSRQSNVFG